MQNCCDYKQDRSRLLWYYANYVSQIDVDNILIFYYNNIVGGEKVIIRSIAGEWSIVINFATIFIDQFE